MARLRNFSEAAQQLFVSQSTLSQQVKQLENELGVALLQRDSHRVELTDCGQNFLAHAVRTLEAADAGIDSIAEVQQLQTGTLRIGTTYTFSLLLSSTLQAFARNYPAVKLEVQIRSMQELMQRLHQRSIDIALSYKPLKTYPGIDSYKLFDNRLAVVVSNTHPLSTVGSISLRDLQRHPLILPMKGMQARDTFDHAVDNSSYVYDVRMELDSVTLLLDLVASSHWATLLSQATARRHSGVVAIPISDGDYDMQGCYHTAHDGYMKYATRTFIETLRQTRDFGLARMNL